MATKTYTGAGQAGNWTDPSNWAGGVPGSLDTALVNGGPNQTVTSSMAVGNLMAIGGETLTFTGTVTSYGNGPCTGVMVCIGSTLDFAPGSTLDDEAKLIVGVAGVGSFVADGTASQQTTINALNVTLGLQTGGSGIMTVDDATVNTGCIWDGFVGNGSMTITDHGTVNDTGDFVEACTAGNTGSLSLTNGATLNVGGGVIIGGISTTAAAGTATASIGAGSTLDVKGAMHVEAGSTVSLAGGTISSGDSGGYMVVMSGASIKGNGVLTSAAPNGGYENDNGMIEASGGTLRVDGTVFGSGAMQIDAGATLAITSQIINPIGITFAGSGSTLDINHGANIQAQLNGFTFGDQIVTSGVSSATWSASNDVLTLYNGSQVVDMLHVLGSYAGDTFQVSQNGSNSIITLQSGSTH